MSKLEIDRLSVSYASQHGVVDALTNFSLTVPEGGMMVLLGESGCGKSTALNSVAGLLDPNGGEIRLGDAVLFAGKAGSAPIKIPPNQRDIGMVFQSYALWPHLSVLENVAYPLHRRKIDKSEARKLAAGALATVRCEKLADRFPGELSGGQQQRVALARALVAKPRLVLFDEPLSNLDASLRRGLRDELSRLHREIGFTGLYVTHDQAEALSLGTEVAIMDKGRIVQSGRPEAVYEQPGTEFVARFFGANVIPGRIVDGGGSGAKIETSIGTLASDRNPGPGKVSVGFMPQAVSIEPDPEGPVTVVSEMYVGVSREIILASGTDEVLVVQAAGKPPLSIGARARIVVDPSKTHVFQEAGA